MKKQVSPKIVALVFGIMVICFAIAFYTFGWTGPTALPPGGNVDPPVNVGISPQMKQGPLVVHGIFDTHSTTRLATQGGSVGIGTATPSQKLDVSGQIHATGDICTDQGGGVCLSTAGGGGQQTAVITGSISHGGTIPLPAGYVQAQCKWFVSIRTLAQHLPLGSMERIDCYANTNRVVTCKVKNWSGTGYGTANYMVICIK